MVKQRITRNMHQKTIGKKSGEQAYTSYEVVRLERKRIKYQKEEAALMKMLDVVRDQMTKIEIEGLQIAANIRQKQDEDILGDDYKTENNKMVQFPYESCQVEDIGEINKTVLNLDNCLDEMFNASYYAVKEEDDDDDFKFPYFQPYEQ